MTELLSPTKRQIADWARLTQKKFRREHRRFLVEGELCVFEAVRARVDLDAVLLLSAAADDWRRRPELARLPLYVLNSDAFARFTKVESSQGILAIARTFALPPRAGDLTIACEQVSDPGNCGALIRVADFFGARELVLGGGSAEIWNGKTVRGSMGSLFRQPVQMEADLAPLVAEWPGTSVALVSHGGQPLRPPLRLKPPVLLVLGHETRGLADDLAAGCTHRFTLAPRGGAESLNLVTAAAVAAFALA